MSEKSDYQKHLESMSEIVYKRLTQGDWSRNETDTRVRCTKDGEFPLRGDEVVFQCKGRKSYIGYFTIQDNENVFISNDGYAYWSANEKIYAIIKVT